MWSKKRVLSRKAGWDCDTPATRSVGVAALARPVRGAATIAVSRVTRRPANLNLRAMNETLLPLYIAYPRRQLAMNVSVTARRNGTQHSPLSRRGHGPSGSQYSN